MYYSNSGAASSLSSTSTSGKKVISTGNKTPVGNNPTGSLLKPTKKTFPSILSNQNSTGNKTPVGNNPTGSLLKPTAKTFPSILSNQKSISNNSSSGMLHQNNTSSSSAATTAPSITPKKTTTKTPTTPQNSAVKEGLSTQAARKEQIKIKTKATTKKATTKTSTTPQSSAVKEGLSTQAARKEQIQIKNTKATTKKTTAKTPTTPQSSAVKEGLSTEAARKEQIQIKKVGKRTAGQAGTTATTPQSSAVKEGLSTAAARKEQTQLKQVRRNTTGKDVSNTTDSDNSKDKNPTLDVGSLDKVYTNKYDAKEKKNSLKVDKSKKYYENGDLSLHEVDKDENGGTVYRVDKTDENGKTTAMGYVNGSEVKVKKVKESTTPTKTTTQNRAVKEELSTAAARREQTQLKQAGRNTTGQAKTTATTETTVQNSTVKEGLSTAAARKEQTQLKQAGRNTTGQAKTTATTATTAQNSAVKEGLSTAAARREQMQLKKVGRSTTGQAKTTATTTQNSAVREGLSTAAARKEQTQLKQAGRNTTGQAKTTATTAQNSAVKKGLSRAAEQAQARSGAMYQLRQKGLDEASVSKKIVQKHKDINLEKFKSDAKIPSTTGINMTVTPYEDYGFTLVSTSLPNGANVEMRYEQGKATDCVIDYGRHHIDIGLDESGKNYGMCYGNKMIIKKSTKSIYNIINAYDAVEKSQDSFSKTARKKIANVECVLGSAEDMPKGNFDKSYLAGNNNSKKKYAAVYYPKEKQIYLVDSAMSNDKASHIVVHETAHAIDNANGSGLISNKYQTAKDKEFKKIFKSCKKTFQQAFDDEMMGYTSSTHPNGIPNEQEMYALATEIYHSSTKNQEKMKKLFPDLVTYIKKSENGKVSFGKLKL